jgi:hypothetical protein
MDTALNFLVIVPIVCDEPPEAILNATAFFIARFLDTRPAMLPPRFWNVGFSPRCTIDRHFNHGPLLRGFFFAVLCSRKSFM